MCEPDPYEGREQTAAKHFILKRYLEALSYKLLQSGFVSCLTYIDGFSGPWKSEKEDFSDTSFIVALNVLKQAQTKLSDGGRLVEVRCFFVEEDPAAFAQLHAAVMPFNDPASHFLIETFQGKFEDAIDRVLKFADKSFSLTFIDPTGWTGYPLAKIGPLLRREPGEVLINFMYNYINRFIGHPDQSIIAQFDAMFGGPGWQERLDATLSPGYAAEKLFRFVLKQEGGLKFVASTTIEMVDSRRPHFQLVHGTRNPKGLHTFREVEFAALRKHNQAIIEARLRREQADTGQTYLFGIEALPEIRSVEDKVRDECAKAKEWLADQIRNGVSYRFCDLWPPLLERFMIRETNVKDICLALTNEGVIDPMWKVGKQQKPKDRDLITLARPKTRV